MIVNELPEYLIDYINDKFYFSSDEQIINYLHSVFVDEEYCLENGIGDLHDEYIKDYTIELGKEFKLLFKAIRHDNIDFSELVGITFNKAYSDSDCITLENEKFVVEIYHDQECCESVTIEDICGDLDNLVGSPITFAEEKRKDDESSEMSATYTFYTIATLKGFVDIRFYGESNGYYSEVATTHISLNN